LIRASKRAIRYGGKGFSCPAQLLKSHAKR